MPSHYKKNHICSGCGIEFFGCREKPHKYCTRSCAAQNRWKIHKTSQEDIKPGQFLSTISFSRLCDVQKNEVYRNARKVYLAKNPILKCMHCPDPDPDVVDIAHIKAVSEFPKEATLLEINQISNLIGLCKSCHWRFDKHLAGKKGNKKKALAAS